MTSNAEGHRRRTWLGIFLVVVIGAGLWRQRQALAGFDWSLFVSTLGQLDWRWLSAAWLFSLAAYYARALRWAVFLRPTRPHPNLRGLFRATVIGFAAIVLLGRPGELVRPYLIAKNEAVPVASQLAAWLLERIYDLLMILLIFGFALSRVKGSGIVAGRTLSWILSTGGGLAAAGGAACLAGLIALAAFPGRFCSLAARLPVALQRPASAFFEGLLCVATPRAAVEILAYSVLQWGLIAGSFACMIEAFGALRSLGWIEVLVFMGFVAFGSLVQIPGIGGGVQVVTVFVLRELYHVPLEVAGSSGVVVWSITFVGILPLGLWFALREGLGWQRLRAMGKETAG